jgi:hypothetical protein
VSATDPLEVHMQAIYDDVADRDGDRANYWCPCHGTALTFCEAFEAAIAHEADYERKRRL